MASCQCHRRRNTPVLDVSLSLLLLWSTLSEAGASGAGGVGASFGSGDVAWTRQRLRATAKRSSSANTAATHVVPGWGSPVWGGRSFDDSVASYNPWGKVRPAPVVGDLEPVAPMDALDRSWSDSFTGAEPVAPTDEKGARPPVMKSDYMAPYTYPRTFPGDAYASTGPDDPDSPLIPIADKTLVASADKLRPPYAWRSSGDYPLIAPADRVISARNKVQGWFGGGSGSDPWIVADTDTMPARFSRYIEQVHDRDQRRLERIELDRKFKAVDADADGTVSREEFDAELQGRQNKSAEETEKLWGKYHISTRPSMNRDEYATLSGTGYDLGAIPRTDIAAVLKLPAAAGPHKGFWGSGARCPPGAHVVGARIKVMPLKGDGHDDTALNGLGMRCGGGAAGAEVHTVEGPDGTWSDWAECPAGQLIYSFRARSQPYTQSRDNGGLAGLEFGCRAADFSAFGELRFFDGLPPPPTAADEGLDVRMARGPKAVGGGWSKELMCPPASAVCGSQAHVVRGQGEDDDMGLVDLRVYCCGIPVDCTRACSPAEGGKGSVGCQVCERIANVQR